MCKTWNSKTKSHKDLQMAAMSQSCGGISKRKPSHAKYIKLSTATKLN